MMMWNSAKILPPARKCNPLHQRSLSSAGTCVDTNGRPLLHQGYVEAVAFSPDGKSVLTGSFDSTARLWDAITGVPIGQPLIHHRSVYAVAFSPDGTTVLTGCQDRTARLWDVATGLPIGEPLLHQDVVAAVTYSPDGKTVLTGCQDGAAQLWNTHTGKATAPPLRHPAGVSAVTFSPDGKTILTGCEDMMARVWDTATGQPIGKPLEHSVMVFAVAFSPDGKTILTGSHAALARLWEAPAPLPDGLPRLIAWVETLTGLELDEQGAIRVLDDAAWRQRRDRLSGLGGPPKADTSWSRDPILFGWDPTARARAWVARSAGRRPRPHSKRPSARDRSTPKSGSSAASFTSCGRSRKKPSLPLARLFCSIRTTRCFGLARY